MNVHFYSQGPIDQVSGGFIYNRNVIEYLLRQGIDVHYHADPMALSGAQSGDAHIVDSLLIATRPGLLAALPDRSVCLMHMLPAHLDRLPPGSRFIASSDITRDELCRTGRAAAEDITVIEPGVPGRWLRKKEYGRTAEKLLCLANYVPGKGHDRLLDVLQSLPDTAWSAALHGNTALDADCHARVARRVRESGLATRVSVGEAVAHDEVHTLMRNADLLLQFSDHESYSMVTAEAIACGLPVLSTKTGNWPVFSRTGLVAYVDDHSPESLSAALQELMSDASRYRQLQGHASAHRRTWDDVGAEFLDRLRSFA